MVSFFQKYSASLRQFKRLVRIGAVGSFGTLVDIILPGAGAASGLNIGVKAPLFVLKDDANVDFKIQDRMGKGWTILYFYPKAETPGCTKQACAFRDHVNLIRDQDAEIYGISIDSPDELSSFRKNHQLNFSLLSDPNAEVAALYGAKMVGGKLAKRYTYIIDSELIIRSINTKVDPAQDAQTVAAEIKKLQQN